MAKAHRLEWALLFLTGAFFGQVVIVSLRLQPDMKPEWKTSFLGDERTIPNTNSTTTKKKKRRKKHKWDPGLDGLGGDPVPLKVGLPIFVPSLPKCGTTSLWQYFQCGGHVSSHQWVKLNETYSIQTGQCVAENLVKGKKPFEDCGDYQVFTDTGYATYKKPFGSQCFYPSIDALDEIHQSYPNVTFVMVVRDTQQWYNSMESWGEGSLLNRWRPCNTTRMPGFRATAKDFMDFYDWHTENIRQFVQRKGIRYIEVQLESNETGEILEREVGIPSKCWAKCTPYSKFCQKAG